MFQFMWRSNVEDQMLLRLSVEDVAHQVEFYFLYTSNNNLHIDGHNIIFFKNVSILKPQHKEIRVLLF